MPTDPTGLQNYMRDKAEEIGSSTSGKLLSIGADRIDELTAELADIRRQLDQVKSWRISTFVQAEGARIVVDYGGGSDSSYPVGESYTIAELVEDHDGTWPHKAVRVSAGTSAELEGGQR